MPEFTQDKKVYFICDDTTPSGAVKIADKVRADIRLVTDILPENVKILKEGEKAEFSDSAVTIIFGLTDSTLIKDICSGNDLDISAVTGKREVYGFFPVEKGIVIVGSDKRGLIYGLFHISDLMGVSPLVNWSLAKPKKIRFAVRPEDAFISKEPSVRYRGFFINDEWPAFGNWCMKNFGGVNRKAYEGIFEMLLRMKGNYLWPAMWASCFAEDGPGLESALLADELGVVMGLSHHEPCLRHGEEYSHVRGKDSIYGDAWDFRSNKEGITRFWRDGLKRNGHLENVITVGMRGERDSMILGEKATLKDNIELIKDVLKTQNQLIAEEVNPNLEEVPRMIALYKEVEAYYYGDENTEGLKHTEDLDNVILMLCDDNHGYVRSLPDEEMKDHKGGFGMYYHFDYHGEPISYEWINCTYLPEVWEEMTTAYEKNIRELWIVNVGDLGLQEMPLSYFLDLAYDYDKYGISAPDNTEEYLKNWMKLQFGAAFSEEDTDRLADIYNRYTRLVHNRRPEHMSDKVYHPQNYYESYRILKEIEEIEKGCEALESKCPAEYMDSFTQLISYNVLAGMNLVKLWIYRGYNHYYASIGAVIANEYGHLMKEALRRDKELTDRLHTAASGKWYGFGLGAHIGFKNWNQEEAANPIVEEVIPVPGAGLMAGLVGETGASAGQDWTGQNFRIREFLTGNALTDKQTALIFVATTGEQDISYRLETSSQALSVDKTEGTLSLDKPFEYITVEVDKTKLSLDEPVVSVIYENGKIDFTVEPNMIDPEILKEVKASDQNGKTYIEERGIAVIDAANFFFEDHNTSNKQFRVVKELGRCESAIKLFDKEKVSYSEKADGRAIANYSVYIEHPGDYEIIFQLLPTHAYEFGKEIELCYSVNGGDQTVIRYKTEDLKNGTWNSWSDGVMNHVRFVKCEGFDILEKGDNNIAFFGSAEENILEKIILVKKGESLLPSYLGPRESVMV